MLRTSSGKGARPGRLVHHSDARREWTHDGDAAVGRLDRGLALARQRGWPMVDMARDWLRVYPDQPAAP